MLAVGRGGVLSALVVIAVLGCRGEREEREARPAPVDDKLAWPAIDEPGLLALAASHAFERGQPVPLAIAPDGAVVFRRSKPREASCDLYQQDAAGKTTVLATVATLGGASGASIEAIELSSDGARVLVPLDGRAFVIERASGASRELAIGAHADPQLSPDGKRVAYVQGGDLWVIGVEPGAKPVRLTQHPPDRDYASAETSARELGRAHGYWWAPDGQSLAFQRTDARAVDTVYLGDPRHPEQAPAAIKQARPGRPIAAVDLGIVSVRGGPPRWITWDLVHYPYLARVIWPAKGPLTLIALGREQTVLGVFAVDAASGATRELLVEKDATWVEVPPDALTWLDDGSGFLWMTESHGAWSLEQRAADGKLVGQVVTGDMGLRRVVGVAPNGVIVEAAGDAREQHVWRAALAGGAAPTALTSGGGVHRALAGHGVVVISSANRAGGHATTVLRADGSRVELPSVAEHPPAAPTTKLDTVLSEDHAQYTAVTRPRAFDAKVRYPVLLRIGADPSTISVLDALDSYRVDQWYADAGFIVVRSDGRGTPGHDQQWARAISGDVLTIPINDQIAALKKLGARHPELDISRVGALGAGFGGYLAALGALIHPDQFAAAVAIAPITDWQLVDAAYAERYLKTPASNPDGYRRVNAATYAEQLKRPLLLVHGFADRRVPFAHTLALVEALSAAGKPVELAARPGVPDAAHDVALIKLQLDFLREHLGPPVRPAVMPAARSDDDEEEEERERKARATSAGSAGAAR